MGRAILLTVLACLLSIGSGHAEDGCPPGLFHANGDNKCTAVSNHNKLPLDDEKSMVFGSLQMSMTMIWHQGTGVITRDTPRQFAKFLETYDAKLSRNLYLHSSGGDLMAGLELGRMIREAGMNTVISRTIQLEGLTRVYSYQNSYCASACAYAFLGGVTRSYGGDSQYGIHRFGKAAGTISGDDAQVISSIVAKYIESMGVDLSVFVLASTSSFERDIFWVPMSLGKQMRIIYDPSGVTSFVIEQRGGIVAAAFKLMKRERKYEGLIACNNGQRTLVLFDIDNSIPMVLRAAKQYPVEFTTQIRSIWGTATYLPPTLGRGDQTGMMFFELPSLDERAFAGDGMTLFGIQNPTFPHIDPTKTINTNDRAQMDAFAKRMQWLDAVMALSFNIKASNANQTLPVVFRECAARR